MTIQKILPLIVLLVAASALSLAAADIKVIANSSINATSVSADELKGVFLATKTALADGSHAEPVLLKSGPLHEAFSRDVLGKSDSALQTYYRTLIFTGKGTMPKTLASEADVVAFVAKTKGAIGYVSAATAATGVKTLTFK